MATASLSKNATQMWQCSCMISRLMDVFITECNARNLGKQNNLLQQLASGQIKTVLVMQHVKDELLSDLDLMKQLIVICESVEDIHINHINNTQQNEYLSTTDPGIIAEYIHLFELCVFGYIRQQIEQHIDCYVPRGVKQLCFMFHGNFILDSNILTSNEIKSVGIILTTMLRKNGLKSIKLFDTECDGFDANKFNQKCAFITHTIGVIRTNYKHVFVLYAMHDWKHVDFMSNEHEPNVAFLFRKSYETTPRILKQNVYVFPNDFDPSLLSEKGIAQIFTSEKEGITDFPGNEPILQFNEENKRIDVEQFEMFQLCTE